MVKTTFKALGWILLSLIIGFASIVCDCANDGWQAGWNLAMKQGTVVAIAFAIYGAALVDFLFTKKSGVPVWTTNLMVLSAFFILPWCIYAYTKESGPTANAGMQLVTLATVGIFALVVKVILFKFSDR